MRHFTLTDDFGRRTTFMGNRLVNESTDSVAGNKPQWVDLDVYRTSGGNFVVSRTTHYRVRHMSETCSRADGYELVEPTMLDTYACPECNKQGSMEGGFAQADRIVVEVHSSPQALIKSFEHEGKYSNLARTILADVAEQDDRVDELWNTVVVP